jgi:hypothetical protein
MLKVKELFESIALEALIKGVNEHTLWRKIYILPDRNLLKVKQVMRNHIQMEEANSLQHRPSLYYMDNQGPSK